MIELNVLERDTISLHSIPFRQLPFTLPFLSFIPTYYFTIVTFSVRSESERVCSLFHSISLCEGVFGLETVGKAGIGKKSEGSEKGKEPGTSCLQIVLDSGLWCY